MKRPFCHFWLLNYTSYSKDLAVCRVFSNFRSGRFITCVYNSAVSYIKRHMPFIADDIARPGVFISYFGAAGSEIIGTAGHVNTEVLVNKMHES